ncbi:MAG: ABC transporter substrate-binding protein [Lachnospiraceae bacterium]|nr:ABC transporter substrate-binding protein [Lachnospiraceae bacterium]
MKNKFMTKMAAAALLLLGVLTGCGSAQAKKGDDYVLKVGYGTVLCQAPLQIAIEKGYFEEEGLNYEAVKMDGLVTEYVGSGQVDASYGLVSKFIQPIDNGLNIIMTSGIHTGCIKLLVKPDSGIKQVADLKGKTVGVNGLAEAPCVLLKRALYSQGVNVTPDNLEVDFVVYNNSDLAMALESDAVDAICLVDPAATVAANNNGYEIILDTATDPAYADEYCCATFVTRDLAEQHPEIAAKYTRAVMKASAWVDENPEEAAKYLIEKEYLSGNPEVFGKILASYEFTPSVQGGYDAVVKNVNEFVQIGLLKENTDVDAFIKKSFVFLDDVEETY